MFHMVDFSLKKNEEKKMAVLGLGQHSNSFIFAESFCLSAALHCTRVVYISSKFFKLAVGSREPSQAEIIEIL